MGDMRISKISKFGASTVFLFFLFSLLGRFLLPFGDEPDFSVVAYHLVENEHSWWSPYYWYLPLIKNFITSSDCIIDANPLSLWVHINSIGCSENIEQILLRFFLGVFVALPLLLVLIFRRPFIFFASMIGFKLPIIEWNRRLNSLGLSLILPGMTYYLGVLSQEQFTLVLSLLVFTFWGNWIVACGLMVLISMIDLGNSVVVFTFFCFSWLFILIAKKCGMRASLLTMFSLVIFAYIVGYQLLPYIENFSFLSGKAEAMFSKSELYFVDKYPVALRPVITFMTAAFMTPSGVKVVLVHLLLGAAFIVSVWKIVAAYYLQKLSICTNTDENFHSFQREIILASSSLSTVLFFVFLFPDYGNAKYYIFLVPFVIMPNLRVNSKYYVLGFLIFCSITVYLTLLLYWV